MSGVGEPTPWELQRSIERVYAELHEAESRAEKHISTESLEALLAPIRQELSHIAQALAQERSYRQGDVTAIKEWAKVEHERLQKWAAEAIARIEGAVAKAAEAEAKREEERKADEKDARRERRADRRVLWAAAVAAGVSVLLWILDKLGGLGS